MAIDVASWLQQLGLGQYEPAFRDNKVDGDVLPDLTAEDLIAIGVTPVGHRRKLLSAIAAISAEAPATTVTATPSPVSAPGQPEAERRQLTVMFCDIVGSTALSTQFDPEDLRELIDVYHRAVAETVARFGGFVAKYMGDGVLIYFGYPQAHEDDAERAVRAGLAVIDATSRLSGAVTLQVRVGIATGLAVVGDLIGAGASQERGVVGETPNLAARLQGLAAPNTLVIAGATRRQVGGLFDLADLGPQALAGFAEPQHAWRVLGESGEVSRFEALRSEATPLVGRDEEIELLLRRWHQAKTGEGRVVLISGEPGIGKSRLTAALSEHMGTEPHTRLRYFCSPHHQDSALYPVIVQLERAAGFARDDTDAARLGKLRALLAPGAPSGDDIALVSDLLSLPNTAVNLNLSPQRKRENLFEAVLRQFEAEARRRPVLMVFEDAQWIDPTSRELLDLTVDRVRRLPVLLVITFRPEFQPPWGGRSQVTSLALNRLGERDGGALVQNLTGNATLSPDIVAEIVERTDGVPLFVEELTKAVLESAAQGNRVAAVLATTSLTALAVPATLHASLMARLDRLGPVAKEVTQIGAVLGREFAYELIEPVAQRAATELQAALGQLGDAGLLFCRGIVPHASYLFKHALVQDAAYSTLLRGRRQELHARVAAALEEHFSDLVERQPELLAQHLAGAGATEQAIAQWLKAGRRSAARSAHAEAIVYYRQGLTSLAALPASPERGRRELELQMGLGTALTATEGWGSSDVEKAYSRALELCHQIGDVPQLFPALRGLWEVYEVRAQLQTALELADRLLGLAQQENDTTHLIKAHHALGETEYLIGDFGRARTHLELGLGLYDPARHGNLAFQSGDYDLKVACGAFLAWTYWFLGYADSAIRTNQDTLTWAREIAHPFSTSFALCGATWLHQFIRDRQGTLDHAEVWLALATQHGFSLSGHRGQLFREAAQ